MCFRWVVGEEFLQRNFSRGVNESSGMRVVLGLKYMDWKLDDYALERGPESEWGSEAGLEAALALFCKTEGFRFIQISLPDPNNFSQLAFTAAQKLLHNEGRQPAGVLVEMFSQFDSNAAWQSGLLPLWLIFNTPDSLEYLTKMRAQFPQDKPVFFSPLATFSMTPDLVPWTQWESALRGLNWINIGTRPSHYPADSFALVHWAEPLRKWVRNNHQPLRNHLTAEEIGNIAASMKSL